MSRAPLAARTPWRAVVVLALGLSALIGMIVLAFVWPAVTASPRHLPVAVAAPAGRLPAIGDTVDVTVVPDRAAAVSAVERREADGAIVVTDGVEVLASPASPPAVRSVLDALAERISSRDGAGAAGPVRVTDVAEPEGDPAALTAASLPLVLGGIIGGVVVSLRAVGTARRLAALLGYACGGGIVVTAILQPWLGVLAGPFGLEATAVGLGMLGTASVVVGLTTLLGPRGILIGAAVTMLVANPLAGVTVPTSFIASPWGTVGQLLVPGATLTLVRELSLFPRADHSLEWGVLAAWAVLGFALVVTAGRKGSSIPRRASPTAR